MRMKNPIKSFVFLGLASLSAAVGFTSQAKASDELAKYVTAPDPSYSWHEVRSGRIGSANYSELILTSHTWRGVPWKHQLIIIRPAKLEASLRQAFLFIHGGRWKPEYEAGT